MLSLPTQIAHHAIEAETQPDTSQSCTATGKEGTTLSSA